LISETTQAENTIILKAIKRDKDAFAHLYDAYVDLIYRYVYYRVASKPDAEDITQDVFFRAWRAIDKYKITQSPFKAWLIVIAQNLINNHYKANKKTRPLSDTEIDEIESDENIAEATEAKIESVKIREAINRLKGDKQKVVLMHFIDGFSYKEISDILHKTEGAIRVIQHRALGELKNIINVIKYER
jgi:RNA polymerase sigma factor (sigma-70 family)